MQQRQQRYKLWLAARTTFGLLIITYKRVNMCHWMVAITSIKSYIQIADGIVYNPKPFLFL